MPRETKEERAVREAKQAAVAEARREAYLATVPKRLMDAQALARSLFVTTEVNLGPAGPVVHFEYDNPKYHCFIDTTLTYQTEEWELESFERQLQELKDTLEGEKKRLQRAVEVWSTLSDNDRTVLKEFIFVLK